MRGVDVVSPFTAGCDPRVVDGVRTRVADWPLRTRDAGWPSRTCVDG